jgi:hypothetical protein
MHDRLSPQTLQLKSVVDSTVKETRILIENLQKDMLEAVNRNNVNAVLLVGRVVQTIKKVLIIDIHLFKFRKQLNGDLSATCEVSEDDIVNLYSTELQPTNTAIQDKLYKLQGIISLAFTDINEEIERLQTDTTEMLNSMSDEEAQSGMVDTVRLIRSVNQV